MPTAPRTALNRVARLALGPRLTRGGRAAIASLVRNPLGRLVAPVPVDELVAAVLAGQAPAPDGTADRGPLVPRVELDVRGLLRGRPDPARPGRASRSGTGGLPPDRPGRAPIGDTRPAIVPTTVPVTVPPAVPTTAVPTTAAAAAVPIAAVSIAAVPTGAAFTTAARMTAVRPVDPLPAEVLRALCVPRSRRGHAAPTPAGDVQRPAGAPRPAPTATNSENSTTGSATRPGGRGAGDGNTSGDVRAGVHAPVPPPSTLPSTTQRRRTAGVPANGSAPAALRAHRPAPRGLADLVAMFATPPGPSAGPQPDDRPGGDRWSDGRPVPVPRAGLAPYTGEAGWGDLPPGFGGSSAPRPVGELSTATDVIEAVLLREARRFGVEVTDP